MERSKSAKIFLIYNRIYAKITITNADVAELADAMDLGSIG